MPRLVHGQVTTSDKIRDTREELAKRIADMPLAFAVVQPVDIQNFDFLFPELQTNPANLLPESRETRDNLIKLGKAMRDTDNDVSGDPDIPAAYTYFGQFVDHDITLETESAKLKDLHAPNLTPLALDEVRIMIRNMRTATLDLDSVYTPPAPRDPANNRKMQIGAVQALNGTNKPLLRPHGKGDHNDCPREGRNDDPERDRAALLGDPRNDENLIVSQLHLAFLLAHNELVEQHKSFRKAQRLLRQHYQHIVLHDFLKRIADPQIVDDILQNQNNNRVYDALAEPFFLPLEFSVAAYRFGHSMIRTDYNFNLNFRPASLGQLFTFTAFSGQLGDFETLPDNWIIEWEHFVDTGAPFDRVRRIDTKLVEPLFQLPNVQGHPHQGNKARLAVRNLLRGYLLRMPTGQAVAQALGQVPLTPQEIETAAASAKQGKVLRDAGFLERTPLWYYILAEAAAQADGQHLGHVGSTIVAEVLIGLVRRSKDSILRQKHWKPSLPSAQSDTFTLSDLLRLAKVL